jgi:hypothetical protein
MAGFGTSAIMVPVMSLFLPLPTALLFVGIIHWFGDIWNMLLFKKGLKWKLILLFGVPGMVVSYFTARLPLVLPESLLGRSLGLFLVTYVLFLFFKPGWRLKPSNINAVAGGALSGFFAAVLGVGGAVRSTFLSAFDLKKSVFLFTSGVIGFLIDSSRIAQYWAGGVRLNQALATALFLSVPVSLLGAYIAKRLVDKIPQKSFRLVIAIALFVVGIRYLLF